MAFRAFIAVEVPLPEEALAAWDAVSDVGGDLKMARPESTHVTLKFLGDTDEGLVGSIAGAMDGAVRGEEPFDVSLRGMGAFPKPSRVRVVWLGMEGAEPLTRMSKRLEAGLEPLGFRRDRPFRPHLTVARTRDGRGGPGLSRLIRDNASTSYGTFRVEELVLKKSVLTPQGPIYSDVRVRKLG